MKAFLTLLLACCLATVCQAKPIKFIHERTASGTLAGVPFSNTPFTFTAWGDTVSRTTGPLTKTLRIDHETAQIELEGIQTVTISPPTRTYISGRAAGVSFFDGGTYFGGPDAEELRNWNMLSTIGPTSGPASSYVGHLPFPTTGGILAIDRWGFESTFTAIVTPEPGSMLLITLPLTLLALRRS